MTTPTYPVATRPNLWLRVLQMLLMAVAFHITSVLLGAVAIVQLLFVLFGGGSNAQLRSFGHSLARYLAQLVSFVTFASEEVPFPFAEWPAGA